MTDQTFDQVDTAAPAPAAPAYNKGELIVHESTDAQTGEVTKLYGVVIDNAPAADGAAATVTVVWLPVTAAALLPHDQVTAA